MLLTILIETNERNQCIHAQLPFEILGFFNNIRYCLRIHRLVKFFFESLFDLISLYYS